MPKQIFYTYKDQYEGFDGCDFTQFKKGKLYFDKGKTAHKLVICPFCGRVAKEEKEGTFFNHKMNRKQGYLGNLTWDIIDSCSVLTQDEYYQILNKIDIIRTANSYYCLSKVKWNEFSDLELWIAIACKYVTQQDVPRKIDYKSILKQEVLKKKQIS